MDPVCVHRTSAEDAAFAGKEDLAERAKANKVEAMTNAREQVQPNFEPEFQEGSTQRKSERRTVEATGPRYDAAAHHAFQAFSNINLAQNWEPHHYDHRTNQEVQSPQREAMTLDRRALELNRMKVLDDISASRMFDSKSLMQEQGFDDSEILNEGKQVGVKEGSWLRRRRIREGAGRRPTGTSEEQDSDGINPNIEAIDKFGGAKRPQGLEVDMTVEQGARWNSSQGEEETAAMRCMELEAGS